MKTRRAVVIGGGLAGLSGALVLARRGWRVTVCEQAPEAGGRARTQDKSGFLFNQGPHALFAGGAAARELAALGVTWKGGAPRPRVWTPAGDGLARFPSSAWTFLTSPALSLTGRNGLVRGVLALRNAPARDQTLAEWLDAHVPDRGARGVFEAVVRLSSYSNAPDQLSARAALAQLRLGVSPGVIYLDGGWRTLVDGLRARAAEAGVEVRTGAAVTELEPGVPRAVRLERGERLEADAVLVATDPRHAARLLPSLASAVAGLVPARAACLDLGLRRLPREGYDLLLGLDEPVYASVHSAVAKLTPEGGALVQLARYLRPDEDGAGALPLLEEMMERLQPGWRDEVVERRFLPNMTVSWGIPTATRARPSARVGEGVRLAGDWVEGEGMLADAAVGSAVRAARELDEEREPALGEVA